jgi:hypothetical protein
MTITHNEFMAILTATAADPTDTKIQALMTQLQTQVLLLPVRFNDAGKLEIMMLTGLDERHYLPLYTDDTKLTAAGSAHYLPVTRQQWTQLCTQLPTLAAVAIDPEDTNLVLWPEDFGTRQARPA